MARPRQISDQQILDAAKTLFVEHGPQCSTAVIARSLGVSQAVLFQRFSTKRELMVAALGPPAEPPFLPLIDAGPDDRPLADQINEIVTAISGFFEAALPGLSVLRSCGVEPAHLFDGISKPPPVLAHKALARWLRRAMKAGLIRDVNAESVAMAWLGAMHGRAFFHVIVGATFKRSNRGYFQDVTDILNRALEPEDER